MTDPIVETEHLLIQILVHMHWLYGNVGTVQATFEKRPKVLNCLSINTASGYIFDHVVNRLMHELLCI